MAVKSPRSRSKRGARASLDSTLAQLGAKAQVVGARAKAAVKRAEDEVVALRHHAAQSALHWIMEHKDRVKAFRGWVKGSAAEPAVNSLFRRLEAEAKPTKAAPRKAAGKTVRKSARAAPARGANGKSRGAAA